MTDHVKQAADGPAPPSLRDQLAAEHAARAQQCMKELQAVLAAHKCTITARTILFYDGRSPILEWDVMAE